MKTLILSLLVFAAMTAQASEYPADYSINSTCQTQGPVEVCRALQVGYGLAVLDIRYNGALMSSPGLSAYVRVNYSSGSKTGSFPMGFHSGNSVAALRITGGCLVGELGGCAVDGTAQMRDLLIYAQRWGGTLNALDLDIAFFDRSGGWDNNGRAFGSYHFDFPQR